MKKAPEQNTEVPVCWDLQLETRCAFALLDLFSKITLLCTVRWVDFFVCVSNPFLKLPASPRLFSGRNLNANKCQTAEGMVYVVILKRNTKPSSSTYCSREERIQAPLWIQPLALLTQQVGSTNQCLGVSASVFVRKRTGWRTAGGQCSSARTQP